jgi:hypothetical protein
MHEGVEARLRRAAEARNDPEVVRLFLDAWTAARLGAPAITLH